MSIGTPCEVIGVRFLLLFTQIVFFVTNLRDRIIWIDVRIYKIYVYLFIQNIKMGKSR